MLTTNRSRVKLAVAAAAVAAVPAAIIALQPSGATGASAPMTLHFLQRPATGHTVDVPPRGGKPSAGDYFVFRARLTEGGQRVGTLHAICTVTRRTANPERTPLLCSGDYRLQDGQLTGTTLTNTGTSRTHIAITGGTGAYAGATGVSNERPGPNGTVRVTVTLQ